MMKDVLFGGTGQPQRQKLTAAETQAVGFDQVTIKTFESGGTNVGGILQFGSTLIYQVPARIDHAEVQELAVHGNPEGYFTTSLWWQLLIEEGSTQEVSFQSQIDTGITTTLTPPRTSGFQYGRYGSLARPQEVYVQLRQSARLLIALFGTAAAQTALVTMYVRVRGVIYSGA